MIHPAANPTPCWEFEGDILVLHHPTTISPKYQAMGKVYMHVQHYIILILNNYDNYDNYCTLHGYSVLYLSKETVLY